jgi:hypothetical protein
MEVDFTDDGLPESLVFFGIQGWPQTARAATEDLVLANGFCILVRGGSSFVGVALRYSRKGTAKFVLERSEAGMTLLQTGSVVTTEERWRWVPPKNDTEAGRWIAERRPAFTGEWTETGLLFLVK